MQAKHEEGLINPYVHKIQALAVKAVDGENVKTRVEAAVKEALEHFAVVKSSSPAANVAAFKGRLKIMAEVTPANQPEYEKTLEYAASLIP